MISTYGAFTAFFSYTCWNSFRKSLTVQLFKTRGVFLANFVGSDTPSAIVFTLAETIENERSCDHEYLEARNGVSFLSDLMQPCCLIPRTPLSNPDRRHLRLIVRLSGFMITHGMLPVSSLIGSTSSWITCNGA